MLYGPIFGGRRGGHHRPDGVLAQHRLPGRSQLPILGVTRLLEGASTAASVPSILGFIALATAGNELLRGKAAARFEGATLAGTRLRVHRRPDAVRGDRARTPSTSTPSSTASRSSSTGAGSRIRPARPRPSPRRTSGSAATSRSCARRTCSLLAPTWIALNASIGLWFSQSLFQFSQANPRIPGPGPDARLRHDPDHARRDRHRGRLRRRAPVLGQPLQVDAADDDHPATGSSAAAAWSAPGWS